MTDVSNAATSLLMAIGLLLVALKSFPLVVARAFIYAGAGILCAHAIGIKVVAPISTAGADTLSLITFCLLAAMIAFVAGRGLLRTIQKDKSPASGAVR